MNVPRKTLTGSRGSIVDYLLNYQYLIGSTLLTTPNRGNIGKCKKKGKLSSNGSFWR